VEKIFQIETNNWGRGTRDGRRRRGGDVFQKVMIEDDRHQTPPNSPPHSSNIYNKRCSDNNVIIIIINVQKKIHIVEFKLIIILYYCLYILNVLPTSKQIIQRNKKNHQMRSSFSTNHLVVGVTIMCRI
jgi:hypothetical protein